MDSVKRDTEVAAIIGEEGAINQPQTLPVNPTLQEQQLASTATTKYNDLNKNIPEDAEILHKAENPWRPSHKLGRRTEDVNKKARSILNKLTKQKFQRLVVQMQSLKIDSESALESVVYLVYEYAVSCIIPEYSIAYANMSRCLSMFKVPSDSRPGKFVSFRTLLLTRCQREFDLFVKRQKLDNADGTQKEGLKTASANAQSKTRKRSLGIIRFIGELFQLKLLSQNIMHDCVFRLLQHRDPEYLEGLCTLLKTVGKEIDTDKAKHRMDQYFVRMTKIVNEKKTSSRVRFMLQDVIDLRKNKWIPRRIDNNSKTIDQIHQDTIKEAQVRAQQRATETQVVGRRGPHGSPRGPLDSVSWNMVRAPPRTSFKTPLDRTIDPPKINISKQQVDESIRLGLGGGETRITGRGSTGREARNRSIGISQLAEVLRERSRLHETEKERRSPTPEAVPELPKEEIYKKTKAVLDKYLLTEDLSGAVTNVKTLPPGNHPHFCADAFIHVLEQSEVTIRQTGHFLHELVKESVISVDSYIKGLLEVLEFAEDMEIDIPKLWTYLGQLVGQIIQDGSIPLSFLKEAAKPLAASKKAGIFVAEVLHAVTQKEGHKKVAKLWQSSGLQWTDFLPKNQIDQFLIDKKLEFTKVADSAPNTPITAIEEELHHLIVVEKGDNESVFDWIESNVDHPTTKRSRLIRALMTCICKSAFVGDGSNIRVEPKEVSKRHNLLQIYLDHQPESELEALYALQVLVTKLEHPPGVLRQMFDILYDEDIISKNVFLQWEKSDEEPGKGVAMKQVVQFFTWLREAEDDNDS